MDPGSGSEQPGRRVPEDSLLPREGFSYRFSRAIVREPGAGVSRGLRAVDRGAPELQIFRAEHRAYVRALERAGLKVEVLGALEAYPDSVFIEDDALCLAESIVLLRPGAASRTEEARLLGGTLVDLGLEVIPCEASGYIDGGDVLATDAEFLVGLSGRTDRGGFAWLKSTLEFRGYRVRDVATPNGVLHFKSDCCVLDGETILATHRLASAECFASYRVVTVPRGEEAAANSLRINDTVFVPAGYPATAQLLRSEGYAVGTLAVSQASLLDGGLSCMSLRLS